MIVSECSRACAAAATRIGFVSSAPTASRPRRPIRHRVASSIISRMTLHTPLAEAARPCRHAVGDCWYVDETDVKVAGRWRYVCRAIDQYGQIVHVSVSTRRVTGAARRFLATALRAHGEPVEVVTDRAPPRCGW